MRKATVIITSLMLVVAACERPPVGEVPVQAADTDDSASAEGSAVDLNAFVSDTAAIGADWYDYDGTTHVLTPSAITNIWRVTDSASGTAQFAAVQPRSYYDENTGESGFFTLAIRRYRDGTYGDVVELRTTTNVKTAAVCVDVLEPAVVPCPAGHLRLETHPRLIVEAALVVAEPVLTVPSLDGIAALTTVAVARVDGTIDAIDVEPTALSYRVNVPEPNMAWGCVPDGPDSVEEGSVDDETVFLVLNRALLGKASLLAKTAQTETWQLATAPLSLVDRSVGAFTASVTIDVPRVGAEAAVVVDVSAMTSSALEPALLTARWNSGSFARYRSDDGRVCTILAPGVSMVAVDDAFASSVVPAP